MQRKWQLADQKDERKYNRKELEESRRYNEKELSRALAYNRKELDESRAYNKKELLESRAYDRKQLEESRAYNRKELEESRAYSRGELGRLVQDAQKAGFNPLTLLRAGGGAGYSSGAGYAPLSSGSLTGGTVTSGALTSSSLTSGSLTATPISRQAPVEQAVGGSPVGDFLAEFGRDFAANFDPFAFDRREQEYRLVESQIASYNAGTLSRSAPPSVNQHYGSSDYEGRPSGQAGALGKPAKWDPGDVSVTNPWKDYDVNPNVSDGSVYEDRYGEVGGSIAGLGVAVADAWHNLSGPVSGALSWAKSRATDVQKRARWARAPFIPKTNKSRYSKYLIRPGGGW